MSRFDQQPQCSPEEARVFALEQFGMETSSVKSLASERDQNLLLTDSSGQQFVLRIANGMEERATLEAQNALLDHLASADLPGQRVLSTHDGKRIASLQSAGRTWLARMVTFVSGRPLMRLPYRSHALLADIGGQIGRLTCVLDGFDHPAFHFKFHWDLANAREEIAARLDLVDEPTTRAMVDELMERFDRLTAPWLPHLPCSVIHNDANDGNVVVTEMAGDKTSSAAEFGEFRVAAFIDFGDAVWSWTIAELAVAIAYAVLDIPDPLHSAAAMVTAYARQRPVSQAEANALFGLICLRLCLSVTIAAEQSRARPDDPYLTISQQPIRRLLPRLIEIPWELANVTFSAAAGLPDTRGQDVAAWLKKQNCVFPIRMANDEDRPAVETAATFCTLDLSVASPLIEAEPQRNSCDELGRRIVETLAETESQVGIGRYLEPRILYATDHYADASAADERRTIHLGIDLFAPVGTQVLAPLDGTVELLRHIDADLDYGTLIILRHTTDSGTPFFTLFGHLARAVPAEIQEGAAVRAGDVLGHFGAEEENGGWPPHLHFQIVLDRMDYADNFPGVCRASRRSAWTRVCPDPNLILNLPSHVPHAWPDELASIDDTHNRRQRTSGGNLSLSYRQPLKMVRGRGPYLFDHNGRRFIDAYNNVPHVGHCHPRVTNALQRQAGILNTNTRYLHNLRGRFCEQLLDTFPDALSVCYLLNSASEANELALRLARATTGQRDMVVLEGAYHGHSTALIDLSPYKHAAAGGNGAPEWVHTAPVADTYRGPHRDPESAGRLYAAQAQQTLEFIQSTGRGVCGFIAESCPSVGGQILFPPNYLSAVYQAVRQAGGVCIADEVQTGYGRLGSVFYGFELQQVIPDIVVLGKPIGNGHPIAAVVTTREIANAFDNGMEFFSTFGGNTVSCAVGMEVLNVVHEEKLAEHAQEVGDHLLDGLRQLQQRHNLIGDVRGSGLFLGAELVRDHSTLEPADREAAFIANRMRDRGILMGTDGPLHNVLKIRPPMVFNKVHAEQLLVALDSSLAECG